MMLQLCKEFIDIQSTWFFMRLGVFSYAPYAHRAGSLIRRQHITQRGGRVLACASKMFKHICTYMLSEIRCYIVILIYKLLQYFDDQESLLEYLIAFKLKKVVKIYFSPKWFWIDGESKTNMFENSRDLVAVVRHSNLLRNLYSIPFRRRYLPQHLYLQCYCLIHFFWRSE